VPAAGDYDAFYYTEAEVDAFLASSVSSFNARTGAVVPTAGDYDAFYYTETELGAGTITVDLDAITATSYGGILEANLVDKAVAEVITGRWNFSNTSGIQLTGNVASIEGASPRWRWIQTGATANNGAWDILANVETFSIRALNDAFSVAVPWVTVARTTTTIDSVDIPAPLTATSYGGITEANLLDKSAAEVVSGAWDFNNALDMISGATFTLWNPANTAKFAIDVDATPIATFDGTGLDWLDFSNFTNGMQITGGMSWRLYDSTDTDFIALAHNGTNALFTFQNTTALQIRNGVDLSVFNSTGTDSLTLQHDGVNASIIGLNTFNLKINGITSIQADASLLMKERAAADSDIAAYGQLWVKNTTPCQLWFTDDAGTDTQIV
jgi:hypothetical protein